MATQSKNKRFNSPFAQLKQQVQAQATKQAAAQAQAAARAQEQRLAEQRAQAALRTAASESETFLRAVAGASPLRPSTPRLAPDPTVERVRLSDDDLALAELQGLVQGHGTFQVHDSEEMLFGLAPGVNLQLLDQLQAGHFAYQRHIDLHGLMREEAHLAVNRFVSSARRDAERCVLIITGRGKSSPDGMSVLRTSLPRWLSRSPCKPHVLAFCTAQAVDGGPGAFYVLLRQPGVKPYGEGMSL